MQNEQDSSTSPVRIAGRYALMDQIGAGGAGRVHRARDEVSGRVVALKQLLAATGKRAATMNALFEREYHTLVRLKHPRIIEVYDYGVAPEGPYYTMEYLEGHDLSQLKQLQYKEVCRHLRDVASSLALIHAQRLVHRDVSPRNIRLTTDGSARLLDFGAVSPFGSHADVVGTPAFMAPEIVEVLPLDPRTDLYSLGAVGYFCLTGRAAFGTQDVRELPRLWQTPPVAPSVHTPGIPPELDRLILSMLSYDPLGRPQTAAAVIDELTVIGGLSPEPREHAEFSYLLSSPMVGRGAQLDRGLARVKAAMKGKGGEMTVEGPAGIGKTRLANELCLAGTLNGTATLRADAEATRARFGAVVALGIRMLEVCPDIARRAAEPWVSDLRHLSPDLAEALGGTESSPVTIDPADRRVRSHLALREWFLAVARESTLLVCVDNAHAADEDTAAFLEALGRESRKARLLLVSTVRIGSESGAPEALGMVRARADRITLSSLDEKACELLGSGLFGGAVHADRVSSRLFTRSGGVPRQFIELANLLVRKQIARYEGGSWVLPLDIADEELPADSGEILSARLSGLSEDAVTLGEAFAIHTGILPLAVAHTLSPLPTEARTHAALGELLAEQILAHESDGYRFRHQVVREALFSRMAADSRRSSQLRAAEALLAFEAGTVADRVEAALHLIDAGERERGARVLVGAARDFAAGAGTHQNPEPLVHALIRMVRAYDEQGRSDYELATLLFPLMPLAYYSSSWRFLVEYGERALEIGLRITGLQRAAELAPELGPAVALQRAFGEAAPAFAEHAGDGTGYDLKSAIAATIGIVPSCAAVYATCFDNEAAARIARAVTPLAFFGEGHLANAMYLFACAEMLIQGSESESRPLWDRALAHFEAPACASLIGTARAKALQGGTLFTQGIFDSYCTAEGALATARRMEDLGVKTWAITADQVRILYHSFRGESAEVKNCAARVERSAVQGAQTSQAEVFWPVLLLRADVLVGDPMAARRRHVELDRRSAELPSLKPHAEAARAAYLMLRGNLPEAISRYEKLLPSFPIRKGVGWETTRSAFAKALNAAGDHARAKTIADEVVSSMLPADHEYVALFLEAQRQLALAESGLGNHDLAAASLDALLAQHGHKDSPLLVGLLHQARAEVARRANDASCAERHLEEMTRRFRSTKNPILIAQCDRARLTGSSRTDASGQRPFQVASTHVGSSAFMSGTIKTLPSAVHDPERIADALDAADEPFQTAVEFLVHHTKAKSAHLYVRAGDELELAWSSTSTEPSPACRAEFEQWLTLVEEGGTRSAGGKRGPKVVERTISTGHRLVALQDSAKRAVLGGIILEEAFNVDLASSSYFFDKLGRIMEERAEEEMAFITA